MPLRQRSNPHTIAHTPTARRLSSAPPEAVAHFLDAARRSRISLWLRFNRTNQLTAQCLRHALQDPGVVDQTGQLPRAPTSSRAVREL